MAEPIRSYRNLGTRTLAIFVVSKLNFSIFLIILFFVFLWGKQFIPPEFANLSPIIGLAIISLALLSAITAVFAGWMEYIHYTIAIDLNAFKVKKGILNQKERSVPYRRIQEVKIQRSVSDQLWGVSTVVVDLIGEAGEEPLDEDRLMVGAVGKKLAEEIRDELLRRAQIEQVAMHPGIKPPQA